MAPSKPALVPVKTLKIILRIGKTKQADNRVTKVKHRKEGRNIAGVKTCMDCNGVFASRRFCDLGDLRISADPHEHCLNCQMLESIKELGKAKYPVYNGVWSGFFQQYVYDVHVKRLEEWQGLCESAREEVQPHEVGEIIEILNAHRRLAKADKVSIREVDSVVESSESETYAKVRTPAKRLAKAKRTSGQKTKPNQIQLPKSEHRYPQLKMLALSKALVRAAEEWPKDLRSVSMEDMRETLSNLTEALEVLRKKMTQRK